MTVTISSEIEQQLRRAAEQQGISVDRLASNLIQEHLERDGDRLRRAERVRETLRHLREEGDVEDQRETLLGLVEAWGPEAFGLSQEDVEAMK